MQLGDYLILNHLTQEDFAKRVGLTRVTINKIVNKRIKSLKSDKINNIYRETNGSVTVKDLLGVD